MKPPDNCWLVRSGLPIPDAVAIPAVADGSRRALAAESSAKVLHNTVRVNNEPLTGISHCGFVRWSSVTCLAKNSLNRTQATCIASTCVCSLLLRSFLS
jgi:hypothetical protein